MKILFVINPISGDVDKSGMPALIDEKIDKTKFTTCEVKFTERAGHAVELAHQAAEDDYDIVVAVGGDGTVNEVGRGLINTDTALGIIPCGSGNGLARHLMLPMRTERCLEIINEAEIHRLDYGIIDNHPFFCTCGMGFDAFISMKFAESGKRGPLMYVENVLREGIKYKPEVYELSDEEGTHNYRAFLISVANASQYGNNAYIAPHASMHDGLLDIIVMEPFDVIDAPQVAIDLMNKTLDKSSKIKSFRSRHLIVHRQHEGEIHFDGEPTMAGKDLDVRVVAEGINIVVNPAADKSTRRPNAVQNAFSSIMNSMIMIRTDLQNRGREALGKIFE